MANLFYPHGLYLLGNTFVGQADDLRLDQNLDELTAYATGDTMPGFTGGRKTEPEYRLDTTDVSRVFTLVANGDENLVRDVSAGNADLYFRQSKNKSTRHAVNTSNHLIYRLIQSAMFLWDSLEVSQDQEAKVATRTIPTYVAGQDTVTLLKQQQIQASPDITNLYTIGKVYINNVAINRIKKVAWRNNNNIAKESADGESQASHVCIDRSRPVVQIDTQELEQIQAFGSQGTALDTTNGLAVYLRRRQQGKINYPDASAVHIRLQALCGSIFWTETSGEKAVGQVSVPLHRPAGGGAVFSITQNIAIP